MASMPRVLRLFIRIKNENFINLKRKICSHPVQKLLSPKILYFVGGGACSIIFFNGTPTFAVNALQGKQNELNKKQLKLTSRERRFIKFASVEYNDQLYMTPQDFLESVVEAEPRPRFKKRVLTVKDIETFIQQTPKLNQSSPKLFRNLRDQGIISYTEYLFLLSVLIKPESGFKIAFNMFDTDGNEKVDKNEFLVIRRLLVGKKYEEDKVSMEKVFNDALKGRKGTLNNLKMDLENELKRSVEGEYEDENRGLQRRHHNDTTLLVHFFGPKGNEMLHYDGFRKFMLNLQTEVLELEFSEFARGLPTISEVDFAKILLRYTHLDTDEYDMYLDRLLDRMQDTKGITFDEFWVFGQFLNNLEDFSIAMSMYTLADRPISKDEFRRAVKICTGANLSQHMIETVFAIFDVDGDGLLSHREFIAIMKDRVHRGFKSYTKNEGWEAFKHCLKQQMKTPT